jgi:hypothetical protein
MGNRTEPSRHMVLTSRSSGGPVVGTQPDPGQRNVVGTHDGGCSYCPAPAVATGRGPAER